MVDMRLCSNKNKGGPADLWSVKIRRCAMKTALFMGILILAVMALGTEVKGARDASLSQITFYVH
jgi:hypothetical protein